MWRAAMMSLFLSWMPGAAPKQICKFHDVVEHLNLSANQQLLLYTTPKRNWEEPLEVYLDFNLLSILAVNEKLQMVTFCFWLNVVWTNEFVSWNPSDFCNISTITLPVNLFWIPDVYIDERADDDKFTRSSFLSLSSNGTILVFQLYRLTASCTLDVHAFPFDEQRCNLSMMPSVQTDREIVMKSIKTTKKLNQESRNIYLTKGEWTFQEVKIIQYTEDYEIGSISIVTYEISMKRRSIFHVLVLILPTFTLFLVDVAVSFAFSSGEIIAFKMTLILENSVLSLILNDMLPATSDDPPVIATFCFGVFVLLVFGIFENAFIVYLRAKKPKIPFVSRFLKKENKESENHQVNLGEVMSKRNEGAAELSLPEKDNVDSFVLLKHVNGELQEIKKNLESHQVVSETVIQQDKNLLLLEKVLLYTRLLISVIFLVYIVIKWTY